VAGSAGTVLSFTSPCSPTYRLAVEPAGAVGDGPGDATPVEELSEVQRAAVTAAVENRTNRSFSDRDALADLDGETVLVGEDRYLPRLVEKPCDTPRPELALGGWATFLVGGLVVSYGVLAHRMR